MNKNLVVVLGGDLEVAQYQDDHEDVVHRERLLQEVSREELEGGFRPPACNTRTR